jgi:hypothetical protein
LFLLCEAGGWWLFLLLLLLLQQQLLLKRLALVYWGQLCRWLLVGRRFWLARSGGSPSAASNPSSVFARDPFSLAPDRTLQAMWATLAPLPAPEPQ